MKRHGIGCVVLLLLTGCGGDGSHRADDAAIAGGDASGEDGKADCAIGGAQDWVHECPVERQGDLLTVRHPDGGFRRFHVLTDGRGLEAADGAEPAKLSIIGDRRIEVATGADRYRLPAQIAGAGQ